MFTITYNNLFLRFTTTKSALCLQFMMGKTKSSRGLHFKKQARETSGSVEKDLIKRSYAKRVKLHLFENLNIKKPTRLLLHRQINRSVFKDKTFQRKKIQSRPRSDQLDEPTQIHSTEGTSLNRLRDHNLASIKLGPRFHMNAGPSRPTNTASL